VRCRRPAVSLCGARRLTTEGSLDGALACGSTSLVRGAPGHARQAGQEDPEQVLVGRGELSQADCSASGVKALSRGSGPLPGSLLQPADVGPNSIHDPTSQRQMLVAATAIRP
jgi:hypothetical protein